MFKVSAESLDAYLAFDPARTADLLALDALIRRAAPGLDRYFHQGTSAGDIGMRMQMIGYGQTRYNVASGASTVWPVIGVALQKNYISVYLAVRKGSHDLTDDYAGRLGARRMGQNNFSFVRFADLDPGPVADMFAEAAALFRSADRH
jgi:hypothetical protein